MTFMKFFRYNKTDAAVQRCLTKTSFEKFLKNPNKTPVVGYPFNIVTLLCLNVRGSVHSTSWRCSV